MVSEDLTEMRRGLAALGDGMFHSKGNDEFIESLSRQVKARELECLLAEIVKKSRVVLQ